MIKRYDAEACGGLVEESEGDLLYHEALEQEVKKLPRLWTEVDGSMYEHKDGEFVRYADLIEVLGIKET